MLTYNQILFRVIIWLNMTFGWELVFGTPSVRPDNTLWCQYEFCIHLLFNFYIGGCTRGGGGGAALSMFLCPACTSGGFSYVFPSDFLSFFWFFLPWLSNFCFCFSLCCSWILIPLLCLLVLFCLCKYFISSCHLNPMSSTIVSVLILYLA